MKINLMRKLICSDTPEDDESIGFKIDASGAKEI